MKKKMRKFAEGGFSSAQEEWLGGADRTDPYILARMRSAVPDEAKPTSRDFDTTDSGMLKSVVNKGLKTYTAKEIADMAPKMIGRESLKLGREPLKVGMKKGGAVKKMSSGGKNKSASSRADGCAIRGKTRA